MLSREKYDSDCRRIVDKYYSRKLKRQLKMSRKLKRQLKMDLWLAILVMGYCVLSLVICILVLVGVFK